MDAIFTGIIGQLVFSFIGMLMDFLGSLLGLGAA